MNSVVKQEFIKPDPYTIGDLSLRDVPVIDLSSSDSETDDFSGDSRTKRSKHSGEYNGGLGDDDHGVLLPAGFLDPLPPLTVSYAEPISVVAPLPPAVVRESNSHPRTQSCKQFWKAGDYEGSPALSSNVPVGSMDHVRVHPKFLHSNATSHKWALGAFAELLDNALDEVCNGATYVNIDMLTNKKDGSRMLLIEDNGGGMTPDKLRACMSLGYSAKSKLANTIGQYGNGFKTSTMRLGADVVVFSRSRGKDGTSSTQSIGMLSYTFLRSTGHEDIVVPMIDYEKGIGGWSMLVRSSADDWKRNMETIVQWSPYLSEVDLLHQFNSLKNQGTRIIIYNIWEDDQGELELDFDEDPHDIQIRGVNRDDKKIQMAKHFPNSRHFLTYRHSLRSYASILYLRLPPRFRMILRGKDVGHHNLLDDMMLTQEVTYRPQPGADGVPKDFNMVAIVKIGFVKDAKDHIDVQGFNVYHKNRLIKPFWRVWNAAGSDGRGVIGVLEANFVEPAHDKQGFERTTVLSRLEARLVQMQKHYWSSNCHLVGYAPRRNKKLVNGSSSHKGMNGNAHGPSFSSGKKKPVRHKSRSSELSSESSDSEGQPDVSGSMDKVGTQRRSPTIDPKTGKIASQSMHKQSSEPRSKTPARPQPSKVERVHKTPERIGGTHSSHVKESSSIKSTHKGKPSPSLDNGQIVEFDTPSGRNDAVVTGAQSSKADHAKRQLHTEDPTIDAHVTGSGASNGGDSNGSVLAASDANTVKKLKDEDQHLKDRMKTLEEKVRLELQVVKDRNKWLEEQLAKSEKKLEAANKEQEALIDIFSEERSRRDKEEENLRKQLKNAHSTILELQERLRPNMKTER
ncbi:hypothetical protein AMTRI_Chr06g191980 [Amborella trichopoda]